MTTARRTTPLLAHANTCNAYGLQKPVLAHRELRAPEIIAAEGHDKAVDWWSLGALIYDMLVGRPPFVSNNKKLLYEKVKIVLMTRHSLISLSDPRR